MASMTEDREKVFQRPLDPPPGAEVLGGNSAVVRDLEKAPGGIMKTTTPSLSEDRHTNDVHEKNEKNEKRGNDGGPPLELIVVDWDGPDDPTDPRNWSALRKWSCVSAVGLMCFVSPLASTMIAPAAQIIAEDPDFMITNPTIVSFIVSIFILGYALGPLVASPISELYGRSLVLQVFMGIFFIFSVACAVAKSTGQMIAFRFLAGVGGAAPLTVGPGIIADIFLPGNRGAAISIFSFTSLFGPVSIRHIYAFINLTRQKILGPVAGGFIVENVQWRWCFWILVIVSGLTLVISPFILTESYHLVILKQKAARIRQETGNPHVITVIEATYGKMTPWDIVVVNLTRPFALLFTNPACFLIGLYLAICYGYMYLMYTSFEFIFTERYNESLGISGLNYIAPGLGSLLACGMCALWMDRVYLYLAKRNGGVAIPEYRVPVMLIASFFMPVGLVLYGWTAENRAFWFWPDLGIFIFMTATMVTFLVMNTYTIDAFKYAASAMAATTVMRSTTGALFPLFGDAMFQSKLGLGWGNTLLALVAFIIGLGYPIFLWFYGPKLRAQSNTDR